MSAREWWHPAEEHDRKDVVSVRASDIIGGLALALICGALAALVGGAA